MEKSFIESIKDKSLEQRDSIINSLGIFELRGLGRELGVPSPTTRKRAELIQLILERLESGQMVSSQGKRKGRPCKKLNNLNQIVSAMTGGDDTAFSAATRRIKPYEEVVSFAQEMPVFSLLNTNENGNFEGVLRLSNNVGYFLDVESRTKVFLSATNLANFNLKSGDYIQVEASKMNSSNQFITDKVLTINFERANLYNPPKPIDKQPVISFDNLPYGDFKLFCGRRNVIEYKQNIYEDSRFSNFVKHLVEKDYKVVVLGLNTSFEDGIMFDNTPGIINLCTKYAESFSSGLDKVVDAITLVERLCQVGKKVVLFVNDIVEILNTLDLCFENVETIMGHSAEAVVITQKLISLARCFSDGSGLTLVMTYRDFNNDDQFLINEVFKVSNKFCD